VKQAWIVFLELYFYMYIELSTNNLYINEALLASAMNTFFLFRKHISFNIVNHNDFDKERKLPITQKKP
jgi:hypothetical protein